MTGADAGAVHVSGQYFLNHDLDDDELRRQIAAMADAGYQNLYAHARNGLVTPYLSEDWWRAVGVIAGECRRRGLRFSLWDEDYYPSGLAGDRIVWQRPELRAQKLLFTVVDDADRDADGLFRFEGAALLKCFAVPLDDDGRPSGACLDVTDRCGTVRRQWTAPGVVESGYSKAAKIPAPHWRAKMGGKCYALRWRAENGGRHLVVAVQVGFGNGTHNSDLMNPGTIRLFLELTHREYARRLSAADFANIHSTFLDEPAPESLFPWTPGFADAFSADHGVDLLPLLAHLAVDIDDRTPWVRRAYRLTQHRLLSEHYLAPLRRWAADHGLLSVGHLSRTEFLHHVAGVWPEELRSYRELDIPCTDPLGGLVAWPDAAAYHTGLKVASSAAHLFGKEQAGSDALGVVGDECGLRDLKFHLDYQMAMGITFFNLHGLSYSFAGPRKDEVPPSLFYQHSEWPWMKTLLGHLRRSAAALAEGRHLCGIGVLYPAAGFYCDFNAGNVERQHPLELAVHNLSERLLSRQRDFDFIDEITLAECVDADGAVRLPEDWSVLVLPGARHIAAATHDALRAFARGGGRVIFVGERPRVIGASLDQPLGECEPFGEAVAELDDALLATLPGARVDGGGAEDVFVLRRQLDNGTVRLFAVNRAETPFAGRIEGDAVRLPARGSLLWIRGEAATERPEMAAKTIPLTPAEGWRVTPGDNHLPLAIWNVAPRDADIDSLHYCPTPLNLLMREPLPEALLDRDLAYETRFLHYGGPAPLRLLLDGGTAADDLRVTVNGRLIEGWRRCRYYDIFNREADITETLHSGAGSPALNVIRIEARGGRLDPTPRLLGAFTAEYRHAHRSLPLLCAASETAVWPELAEWSTSGFPAYAGPMRYEAAFDAPADGRYELDLGAVSDLAEVAIDDGAPTVLPWPPYRLALGRLARGRHKLTVTVACGPGNRERLANLAVGWLGPVTLIGA